MLGPPTLSRTAAMPAFIRRTVGLVAKGTSTSIKPPIDRTAIPTIRNGRKPCTDTLAASSGVSAHLAYRNSQSPQKTIGAAADDI